jgi:hypothetical protein
MKNLSLLWIAWLLIHGAATNASEKVPVLQAKLLTVQVLAASAATPERPYLAFPAIVDLGPEVLISYKHGKAHAGDVGATLDWLRYDKTSQMVRSQGVLASLDGEIIQMGEWVRFPNGDIANYLDIQRSAGQRSGLGLVRSEDGGRSFSPVQRLGVVDGVEYGYAFDACSRKEATWLVAMTFANLPGGHLVHRTTSQPGSVDVLRSDDHGRTWRFVCSLTQTLDQAPINESTLVAFGDGYLIAARGYDGRQWLLHMDADFQLIAKTNLREAYPFLQTIDRPRLFARDGVYYLLGRNRVESRNSELALFRLDPERLSLTQRVVLAKADGQSPADSFYAQPFWTDIGGRSHFHVITYQRGEGPGLDIVRLEYAWDEIR